MFSQARPAYHILKATHAQRTYYQEKSQDLARMTHIPLVTPGLFMRRMFTPGSPNPAVLHCDHLCTSAGAHNAMPIRTRSSYSTMRSLTGMTNSVLIYTLVLRSALRQSIDVVHQDCPWHHVLVSRIVIIGVAPSVGRLVVVDLVHSTKLSIPVTSS